MRRARSENSQRVKIALASPATIRTRCGERNTVALVPGVAARTNQRWPSNAMMEPGRTMVGTLIDRLFSGDPKALLAHLVSENEVAAGDLAKVQALLAKGGRRRG